METLLVCLGLIVLGCLVALGVDWIAVRGEKRGPKTRR